jgi:hypothetical protein
MGVQKHRRTKKRRETQADRIRKGEEDVRRLYADYRLATGPRRAKLRRRVDLAIERLRVLNKGATSGPRGVGIIRPTGPKIVGDSTAVHRTHRRQFKSK